MQGIYQGFPMSAHDVVWTVLLDMAQDASGVSHISDVYRVLRSAGDGAVIRE